MSKPNLIVVGAGKMGSAFINAATEAKYDIAGVFDDDKLTSCINISELDNFLTNNLLVKGTKPFTLVDFTLPDAFMENLNIYLKHGLQVVTGTTGWFNDPKKLQLVADKVNKAGTGLIYSGNYSLGVMVTYQLADLASKLLNQVGGFDVSIIEEHHVNKADSPSGTAKEMADIIMRNMENKTELLLGNADGKIRQNQLQILSLRLGDTYGTHVAIFRDKNQRIEIKHESLSREHFAAGALPAVEFIQGENGQPRKGIFTMQDCVKSLFAGIAK